MLTIIQYSGCMADTSSEYASQPDSSPKNVRADLDAVDRSILGLLHDDARMTNNALAEAVGIAPSTCHGRVRRLVDLGGIPGFYTHVDPVPAGFPPPALIS